MQRRKFDPRNPKYIRGIYNYCDAWCKKCPFTSRCLTYDMEKGNDLVLLEVDLDAREAVLADIEDQGFMEDTEASHIEDKYGFSPAIKSEEFEQYPSAIAASEYADQAGEWLRGWYTRVEAKALMDGTLHDYTSESVPDAVQTIGWYHLQIYVKIMRALRGQQEAMEFGTLKNMPNDSDGSAKVALIGIDNSLEAITRLAKEDPADKHELLLLSRQLKHLKTEVEATFPNARAFVRPGFDNTLN